MTIRHIGNTKVKAEFSPCEQFRYTLTIDYIPSNGSKTVCAIMQNPSKANEEIADKSVQFLEKLIFEKDYEEFSDVRRLIIVNQFAFIETNNFKGREEQMGPGNDRAIKEALEHSDIGLVAWGKTNKHEKRKRTIFKMISESLIDPIYFTKKHPSRGCYTDFIYESNI
jgi:hypothetical protein